MTDEPTPAINPPAGVSINEIYKEQYAHFRGMNDILYKIPPLFTAVIGGLWYFAVQSIATDKTVSAAVFAFTALASISFVIVMERFRAAFVAYIDNLNKMDGKMKVSIRSSCLPSTIKTIQFLLLLAGAISLAGVVLVAYRAGLTVSFKP